MSDPASLIQIQILSGSRQNKELSFFAPQLLRFGRHPEAEVFFENEDSMVSKHHAELVCRDGQYVLSDTASRFGTFLLARDELANQLPLPAAPEKRMGELPLQLGARVALQLGLQGPTCRILAGKVVPFGRYLLAGRLGQGGMGEVYLAWEPELSRFAVVKLVRYGVLKFTPHAEEMLREEARIAAQLDNSHGARVYEVNKEQGVLYVAMEYLRGVTLSDLCAQMKRMRKRLPHDLCCALIRQACLGLSAAHALVNSQGRPLQVVHRDVSANNVMCTLEGDVKVIDFGVARAQDRQGDLAPGQRKVVGNPAYMSPEHVESPQAVDQRSDVFSAAVILYELCTGDRLFLRDSMEATLGAVCACKVPPLQKRCPEAPDSLVQAVHGALSRSPAERPRTALEFARQLQQVEAASGNRFSLRETIASYLISVDVPLMGRLPVPLTREPESLLAREPSSSPGPPSLPPLPPRLPPTGGAQAVDLQLPLAQPYRGRTPAQSPLEVRYLELAPWDSREPAVLPLPLPAVSPARPEPLLLYLANQTLELKVCAEARDAGKIDLYRDEPASGTRCLRYVLPSSAAAEGLYVGYHRAQCQKLNYFSAAGSAAEAAGPSLDLPEVGLRITAPPGSQRLMTMYTTDPRSGAVQVACVAVRSA